MPKMKNVLKEDEATSKRNNERVIEGAWQMWHRNGTRCPKGTVPLRRSTEKDVLRAKSLFDFGKKQQRRIPLDRRADAPDVVSGNGHEVGYLFPLLNFSSSFQYFCACAYIITSYDIIFNCHIIIAISLFLIFILLTSDKDVKRVKSFWKCSEKNSRIEILKVT